MLMLDAETREALWRRLIEAIEDYAVRESEEHQD